jgi:hypothetical protein
MDQSAISKTFARQQAKIVIHHLKHRQIEGFFCETKEEALKKALSFISKKATVTQGGSVTLDQVGVRDALLKGKNFTFIDPYAEDLTHDQRVDVRRKALLSDVFFCSTNAITLDGVLVNRDGVANRVAAMAFGPAKVIVITGVNKIVRDIESGINRLDTIASPMNCIRLERKTPCVGTVECQDCDSEDRICCVTTIIERQRDPDRMKVIIIGEALGY